MTYADEREARTSLVSAGRSLVRLGLSPGSSGNLSVRVGSRIIASPSGIALDELLEDELAVVSLDGVCLEGPPASKEVPLHAALYDRNPGARAVAHVHSPAAVAVSCLRPWSSWSALPPYTPYPLMVAGQVPLIDYAAPGTGDLGERVRRVKVPFNAALLANHGSVSAAPNAAAAVAMLVEVEQACDLTLRLEGMRARLLTDPQISELCERHRTPWTPTT